MENHAVSMIWYCPAHGCNNNDNLEKFVCTVAEKLCFTVVMGSGHSNNCKPFC